MHDAVPSFIALRDEGFLPEALYSGCTTLAALVVAAPIQRTLKQPQAVSLVVFHGQPGRRGRDEHHRRALR